MFHVFKVESYLLPKISCNHTAKDILFQAYETQLSFENQLHVETQAEKVLTHLLNRFNFAEEQNSGNKGELLASVGFSN